MQSTPYKFHNLKVYCTKNIIFLYNQLYRNGRCCSEDAKNVIKFFWHFSSPDPQTGGDDVIKNTKIAINWPKVVKKLQTIPFSWLFFLNESVFVGYFYVQWLFQKSLFFDDVIQHDVIDFLKKVFFTISSIYLIFQENIALCMFIAKK